MRAGICIVPERTSTAWWQSLVAHSDLVLCVNRKIPFTSSAGEQYSAFPIGSTLVAIGEQGVAGLLRAHRNGLGILLKPIPTAAAASHRAAEGGTSAEYANNPTSDAAE